MKETISSSGTFLAKIIFPIIWISGFGYATLMAWINPSAIINPSSDVAAVQIGSFVALILGSLVIYWLLIKLKKVCVDEHFLYVSNYIKEVRIPLAQIDQVTEERWGNAHAVVIDLKSSTEFGYRIRFIPKARLFISSQHPVVAQLQRKTKRGRKRFRR